MANSGVAAYFAGGLTTGNGILSAVDKFAFPADTRSTLGTGLSSARYALAGMANSGVAGYFGGGFNGSAGETTVEKYAFPSDTKTSVSGGLSSTRYTVAGFANEGTF
jgi:hypothetical protein